MCELTGLAVEIILRRFSRERYDHSGFGVDRSCRNTFYGPKQVVKIAFYVFNSSVGDHTLGQPLFV